MKQFKITILFTVLMSMVGAKAMAYDAQIGGIFYIFNGTEAQVTYYSNDWSINESSYKGNVIIPESVTYYGNGTTYRVTSIGYSAFQNCSSLTSVTIPNSVTSIDGGAFSGCSGLTSLTIPNSVTSIGGGAFSGCSSLTMVTIPNSVTSIEGNAFSVCSGLTSITVEAGNTKYDSRNNCNAIIETESNKLISGCKNTTIPNSVTSIGGSAFRGSSLTSVTIPNSVTSIDGGAFSGCSGLTSLTIPNSVTSIGEYAFNGCNGLTSVTIGNSVTSIGEYAFKNNSNLTSVEFHCKKISYPWFNHMTSIKEIIIGDEVTSIGSSAFYGCTGLVSVTIGNSVTVIESDAFQNCSSLTSVTIPNSVTRIGANAFALCSGLISMKVESGNTKYDSRNNCNAIIETASNQLIKGCKNTVIPNSVTSIGNSAFAYCSDLTSIAIPNSVTSIGSYAFQYCSDLTSITIPNRVTSIRNQTFQYCSGLTSVTIGNSVASIGAAAFSDCSGLTSVKVLATTPPTAQSNSFYRYDIPLYVPETSIETYSVTSPWSSFTSISALSLEDLNGPCATPTIKYVGGKLKFECETEGVEFVSHFSTPDNNTSEVEIPTTYTVSVYARKDGYLDSETVTADIDVRGLKGDVNGDKKVDVSDIVKIVNIILNGSGTPSDEFDTSMISASFGGGTYSSIKGVIQSGSQLMWRFSNNSLKSVTLTSLQMFDGVTGTEGNNVLTENVEVVSGETKGYTITVGVQGIQQPKARFTYQYNNKTYTVEAVMPD